LVCVFQGGIGHEDRYAAFNLHNVIGTIKTVEIRIKHGSTDMTENRNFMLFFAHFFAAVIKLEDVVSTWFSEEEKQKLFNAVDLQFSYNFLMDKIMVGTENRQEFKIIKDYWSNVLNNKNTQQQGAGKVNNKIFLFSYGSNNTTQLRERIKNKMHDFNLLPGYLPDHVRIFCGNSKKWHGGVASVYPANAKKVYGIIVEITSEGLKLLDVYEKGYERQLMTVYVDENTPIQAYVYVKLNVEFDQPPSPEYLTRIMKTLHEPKRCHKNVIIIRGVVDGKLLSLGKWSATL
jgi:gamma-glutamylcyclotransferase